jgi:glutathione S-transferase
MPFCASAIATRLARALQRWRAPLAAERAGVASRPDPAWIVARRTPTMSKTVLTISSRNYSSWSLRGFLLTRFAGVPFEEKVIPADDPAMRAEILLLSSSILVPCLTHNGIQVWDTLAIAEYLNEVKPKAGLLPAEVGARARCRSISGEMHSGFASLRSALPMNLKAHLPNFNVWSRAKADIDRITTIWRDCLGEWGGPFLFGKRSMADAMYAPVCTRLLTYDVKVDKVSAGYCETIMAMPEMQEWVAAAREEPDDIDELDVEF